MAVAPVAFEVYRSSPTKRGRRTQYKMAEIRDAILAVLSSDHPMTVRQVFYQVVGTGLIEKTEMEYKGTVGRLLVEMRTKGTIPYGWISDNTRWMRRTTTFTGMRHALEVTAAAYRRNLWESQDAYVEVWLEKDALAGVLNEVTAPFDVALAVTRGYPSLSYLFEAGQTIRAQQKPIYIYYFGDHDPSGHDITRNVEERLREFAPYADITFERVAVRQEQIERWNLPTRPTKGSDTRSGNFEGESVEVDAIRSTDLRQLAKDCITRHIDTARWDKLQAVEDQEKASLLALLVDLDPADTNEPPIHVTMDAAPPPDLPDDFDLGLANLT